MPFGIGRSSGVAVVEMHGVIGSQIRTATYTRIFETVARSKSYRALLLDIDSPGGSASASETLHRSIERVAEVKPVLAYVRGIGASGGYYLCCAASQVFTLPTAMVGSIGVLYLRPVIEQLLGRAGVEFSIFKGGKYKDMTGFWRSPTSEEAERLQGLIDRNLRQLRAGRGQGTLHDRGGRSRVGHRRGNDRPAGHRGWTRGPDRGLHRRIAGGGRGRRDEAQGKAVAAQAQPVAATYGANVRVGRLDDRTDSRSAETDGWRGLLHGPHASRQSTREGLGNPGALSQEVGPKQLRSPLYDDAHGPAFRVEVQAKARSGGLFRVSCKRRFPRLEP